MKHVIFAGIVELMRPLTQFTVGERERLAEQLALVVDDIRKGTSPPSTQRFVLEVEAEPRD